MQSIWFFGSQQQQLGAAMMDVPHAGDSVVLPGQQPLEVHAVRYFVGPNQAVRVAVMLVPYSAVGPMSHFNLSPEVFSENDLGSSCLANAVAAMRRSIGTRSRYPTLFLVKRVLI